MTAPPPRGLGRSGGVRNSAGASALPFSRRGETVNPWEELIRSVDSLAQKLRAMRPPKMGVAADGHVLYWGLVVPSEEDLKAHGTWPGQRLLTLEEWLVEKLNALKEKRPDAREVELWGVWAGKPPRLVPIAKVPSESGESADGERDGPSPTPEA
jgi:hypothetical protein